MSVRATLKDAALKTIERRHPWIFSGAIQGLKGHVEDGDIIRLVDHRGNFLARGYWNSHSQIQLRLLSWQEEESIDQSFWRARLQRAIEARGAAAHDLRIACRLVNAENDYLPGLIVDRYGEWLVLQALTLGIERRKGLFVELLAELMSPAGIYERSDVDVREKEGLPQSVGLLWGQAPPQTIEISEEDRRFLVDIQHGHKTGFYLDQSENRRLLQETIATAEKPPALVLNAFGYTGAFAVAALKGGAVCAITVDSSASALDLARQNIALNGLKAQPEDFVEGDVFQVMRHYRDQNQRFDCIILDPPKFAQSAQQVERASRGYKDINLLAFRLLKAGGWLWTFSCSNAVNADLFQKIVFGALIDAGREGQIVRHLTAAADHPVALTFPEGAYLKGLVCRVW